MFNFVLNTGTAIFPVGVNTVGGTGGGQLSVSAEIETGLDCPAELTVKSVKLYFTPQFKLKTV